MFCAVPAAGRLPAFVAILLTCAGVVFATSPVAAAEPRWPAIASWTRGPATPADVAVIVAAQNYTDVPDVPGAAKNGRAWYRYFIERRGIPSERVQLLEDKNARDVRIRKAVTRAAALAGPDSTLWFVFIGHGAATPDGKAGVLIGTDADQDPDMLYARSVRQPWVARTLTASRARHVLMVIDSCFSGRTASGGAVAKGLQPLIALRSEAPSSRLTLMTAGTSSQFAGPLPGAARPAFSYLLLGALRGWGDRNRDGRVTAKEAIAYANKTLTSLPLGRSQHPQLMTTTPSFVLATSVHEPAPDLDAVMQGKATAPPLSCPKGSRSNGTTCVGLVKCPSGMHFTPGHGCTAAAPSAGPKQPEASLRTSTAGRNLSVSSSGGPKQPKVSLSSGALGGEGAGKAGVAKVIRRKNSSIRRCYQAALRTQPGLSGNVTVTFTVGTAGLITSARVAGATGGLAACISEEFLRVRGLPMLASPQSFNQSYVFTNHPAGRTTKGAAEQRTQPRPPCGDGKACYNAGRLAALAGDAVRATALFEEAVRRGLPRAHGQLARLAFQRGDKSNCLLHGRLYLVRYPDAGDAPQVEGIVSKCR